MAELVITQISHLEGYDAIYLDDDDQYEMGNKQDIHSEDVKFLMFVKHSSENVKQAFDFKRFRLLLMVYFWETMNTLDFLN